MAATARTTASSRRDGSSMRPRMLESVQAGHTSARWPTCGMVRGDSMCGPSARSSRPSLSGTSTTSSCATRARLRPRRRSQCRREAERRVVRDVIRGEYPGTPEGATCAKAIDHEGSDDAVVPRTIQCVPGRVTVPPGELRVTAGGATRPACPATSPTSKPDIFASACWPTTRSRATIMARTTTSAGAPGQAAVTRNRRRVGPRRVAQRRRFQWAGASGCGRGSPRCSR